MGIHTTIKQCSNFIQAISFLNCIYKIQEKLKASAIIKFVKSRFLPTYVNFRFFFSYFKIKWILWIKWIFLRLVQLTFPMKEKNIQIILSKKWEIFFMAVNKLIV